MALGSNALKVLSRLCFQRCLFFSRQFLTMFPCLCINMEKLKRNGSWKKNQQRPAVVRADESMKNVHDLPYPSVAFNHDPLGFQTSMFSLRSDNLNGIEGIQQRKREMSNRITNFSDLIQRVTASCLLHPLAAGRHDPGDVPPKYAAGGVDGDEKCSSDSRDEDEFFDDSEKEERFRVWREAKKEVRLEMALEMETVMGDVFDAVSAMKKAYVSLQEAHCPWDPERMRQADVAVVAELKRLGVLRERFRRSSVFGGADGGRRRRNCGAAQLREVVAPYEAAVEDLKREVKAKDAEVENLKEKLNRLSTLTGSGRKSRSQSRRKISCSQAQVSPAPAPELFEATMSLVKEASKSFTASLFSLMRTAHWDIAAAVRSIEVATTAATASPEADAAGSISGPHHAKYALESYLCRKIFQGFDHETFYMDGSLSSLLQPDQYRRDCFAQYRDMKAMDPAELLGILPTCQFGKFCAKKYLAIVHPKMEESLFGDMEHRRQVVAGNHPRSQFYGGFLGLAKAVWLLHLLAFSFEPAPSQFEASRGAEFHPQYMESVVKFSGGRVPVDQVVGFPVSPGFKLGNDSVVKTRVYLVSRN